MPTFRLTLEYDGTDFEGWQTQPAGHRTVQDTLARAVEAVTGARPEILGAGRTDAGVHAEAQLAAVRVDTRLAPEALLRALNAKLPPDLAVRAVEAAPDDYHALRDARSKLYRYTIWNGAVRSPLRARSAWWVPGPLDTDAMARAAKLLLGHHDFAAFGAAGSDVPTTDRTLSRLDVAGAPGGEITFAVEGTGFLRHMVRNLVGTLVEVGQGRREPGSIPALLAGRDRGAAGPTAPARGLTLLRVDSG